jgi:merlin protein
MRPLGAKKRLLAVEVQTMDALLEFEIDSRALGRDLLQLVCRTIGLRESCFFGLQFFDSKSNVNWLKENKRLNEQDVAPDSRRLPAASTTSSTSSVSTATSSSGHSAPSRRSSACSQPLVFHFLAKFFPEDVSEELVQEVTQHLFYLQVSL